MLRLLCLSAALLFSPLAQAEDLLDWLEEAAVSSGSSSATETAVPDQVELVTLESRETEMYPKLSPDGKYMLVVSSKSHKPVISRRLVENGDPINIVSDSDRQVLDSISWKDDKTVVFLSYRADSLGFWEKPVEGGMIRRSYQRLDGELRTPILLKDGSLVAVRLHETYGRYSHRHRIHTSEAPDRPANAGRKADKAVFDNWKVNGKQPHLVHISREGAESQLTAGVNPSLSPDGKRLVFSMQAGRSYHLFMMNVDGSELVQLTDGRSIDVQPSWSPDGKWIAFTSNRGQPDVRNPGKSNWDIWLIGHDGHGMTRLTHDKARDGAPCIGKNGRVYFHSDRKVSKEKRKEHQVSGSTRGFHIWSAPLPAEAG